jgi:hypothetical protein
MSRFVQGERVPVSDGQDTIWILPKMNFAQREQAEDAIRRISASTTAAAGVEVNVGAYRIALLRINVVAWEGPGFDGMKCTPEQVEQLDPDDPLLEKVMQEIAQRNPLGGRKSPTGEAVSTPLHPTPDTDKAGIDPLPGPSEDDGGSPWTVSSSTVPQVPGIPTSSSPNGTNGLITSLPSVTPTS